MGLHCDQLLQGIMGFVVQGVSGPCICALYSLFMPQCLVQTDAAGLRRTGEIQVLCIFHREECQATPSFRLLVETQTLHNWKMEQKSHGKRKEERKS